MRSSLTIKRISSLTLLKIMLITVLFPWILLDTVIILGHLINGDYVVNYTRGEGADKTTEQLSLWIYILISYPAFVVLGVLSTLFLWLPSAFSLWLWSRFRGMRIDYYELDEK
ncbi:MAG: hypothetical protein G8D61_08815 [gamma proteobacterium symbiont of Ctena orbiculata]|nr:hypothetical protein [Candidatus Thiodiazotropha taylori]MBT3059162.1 hypothetical protein [Candidatus Thiodiazotropha sp. (ex Lucina pensylvanica)]MBV2093361.1 hypothetical protein [Candidatus Thiodiazotropha sp. (ex Codakia orbicularis)]PUB75220.1 MAG: hypothetical protein DBP03_08200 [gamma proteobacterium symbiont of Ctena orbiculata]MBT3064092.1 hypothetical protein [Candidatus Thiodiazotropha sp. (ex Lucina pensylvanica)]